MDFEDRPKVKGDWKCAGCGTSVTELPFEPTPGRDVFCGDCWKKNRDNRPRDDRPRRKFQGDWSCKDCGAKITELPFQPKDASSVLCVDCWKKNRG